MSLNKPIVRLDLSFPRTSTFSFSKQPPSRLSSSASSVHPLQVTRSFLFFDSSPLNLTCSESCFFCPGIPGFLSHSHATSPSLAPLNQTSSRPHISRYLSVYHSRRDRVGPAYNIPRQFVIFLYPKARRVTRVAT